MLSVSDISKSYGDQTLFSTVTFNAGAKERIAIIGPNESGKQIADQDLAWQNLVLSKNSITEQLLI